MTRKRFIKLCMAGGYDRNYARALCFLASGNTSYERLYFWHGPDRTKRRALEKAMIGFLDERTNGVMGLLMRELNPFPSYSYFTDAMSLML